MIDVQQRGVTALMQLASRYPAETVALVSHGDVLLYALGMPVDCYDRLEVSPARVSVVTLNGGVPTVLQVNGDSVP
jgi:probable phosphoglycerate mutase